ncbi:MAG: 16S rRNA m(7)G-527 methyltransferase [Acidobacteria bacterium OLB17]|nr:MAG: 16S rRNA m(7)G-527 methyltransferase [Acidobacteria bacterium OLB17]
MVDQFKDALQENAAAFGIEIADETAGRLAMHCELVLAANPLLHLTGPISPGEFAVRHTLESLFLLKHLPAKAKFIDIGPGGGFPSIPCLIAREDLAATLIESKIKKAEFLADAARKLGISDRVAVINKQFSEAGDVPGTIVTCRALDKFTERLPALLRSFPRRRFLLFGGPALREVLAARGHAFQEFLLPMSERRFLFVLK